VWVSNVRGSIVLVMIETCTICLKRYTVGEAVGEGALVRDALVGAAEGALVGAFVGAAEGPLVGDALVGAAEGALWAPL
jgi:hypothetical protein